MIPEIGQFTLILALVIALAQGTVPLIGAARDHQGMMAMAATAATAQFALILFAFAALTHSYVVSDFSVVNVAANSHTLKPLLYKISGVWGNHEGSMLLWVLILALFGLAVGLFGGNLPPGLRAPSCGCRRRRSKDRGSTRSCRTPVSPSIRRFSISAMSGFRWRFPLPSPR